MSIWGSICTFGRIPPVRAGAEPELDDEPYSDFTDSSGHYTANDAASLASTPRGGWLDVAASGMCDLIRFGAEESDGREAEVWLDRRQAAMLRDALTAALERRPVAPPVAEKT